jgi:hypothetical protein
LLCQSYFRLRVKRTEETGGGDTQIKHCTRGTAQHNRGSKRKTIVTHLHPISYLYSRSLISQFLCGQQRGGQLKRHCSKAVSESRTTPGSSSQQFLEYHR